MQLDLALKEWAVLCRSLADGTHVMLLRKGGIDDPHQSFRLEHSRFLLFPTYLHQQAEGIKDELQSILAPTIAEAPTRGTVHISLYAQVVASYQLNDLDSAKRIDAFHGLSWDTVQSRFHYRKPGLIAIVLRVHALDAVHSVPDNADYAGCKSWLRLHEPLSIENAKPILGDDCFRDKMNEIDRWLSVQSNGT